MSWPTTHRKPDGEMLSREDQLYPMLEAQPDFSRGEIRLAAEVATLVIKGKAVPADVRCRVGITLYHLANSG